MDRETALALPWHTLVQYRGRRIFRLETRCENARGQVKLAGYGMRGASWFDAAECEVPPNVRELYRIQETRAYGFFQTRAEAADCGLEEMWDQVLPNRDDLPADWPQCHLDPFAYERKLTDYSS